ncbi:PREDICTED: protein N-lysine methyltransferase METTL21A [Camelina sativa]|uniref:Protein N-lysine methyltransferase METTL21A n=1 Tax=Camelina sativa TaxID=90675 RepID=A0ABM0UJ56_CAMSA|nr:PREDICTED: protein N-lysine methyltransferase METTL21A [Camelina sativa]
MKFTDSPVIDLTVKGTKLSIQQDNGSMHVGTSVWPCSLILSKFAERWSTLDSSSSTTPNPYAELFDFRRRRGVELGTGCGVAGMAFHLLGLTEIVLTDIAPVMPALKHNLKRNKAALGKSLKASVVYWNNRDQISALNPPFDLVIAADVVYIEESVGQLVTAMESLLADDGAVLLGYQIRSPEADKLFWEMCDVVFRIEKVPHEHLHHEYAYEETDVYIFRKKVKKVTEAESESES